MIKKSDQFFKEVRMKKIITIGEYLIDMLPETSGVALQDVEKFQKKPGGAPINVAVGIHRLGGDVLVVTQVGEDAFGKFLIDVIKKEGMDTKYIYQTSKVNTCLAFVSLDAQGDRDFMFYRNPSADQLLDLDDMTLETIDYDIIHFGSVGLAEYPLKDSTDKFIEHANKHQKIISFDVNIRDMLFQDTLSYRTLIRKYINKAHIIKLSIEELFSLSNEKESIKAAVKDIMNPNHKIIIISDGANGVYAFTHNTIFYEASLSTEVIDTTGAGDALMAGFLFKASLANNVFESEDWIQEALKIGVLCATKTIQKKGAMEALPRKSEI